MSEKIRFEKLITPVGVARYPHLTEPDTKFDSDGVFHTKLVMSAEEAAGTIAKIEAVRDNFYDQQLAKIKKTHKLAPAAEPELDDDGNETGNVIFTTKMKFRITSERLGKSWEQTPRIFGADNKPVTDVANLRLWGGSRIALALELVPYAMGSTKLVGVSLRLKAVQIHELSSGNPSSGDKFGFEEHEDGYTVPDESDFDTGATDSGDKPDQKDF